MLIRTAGHLLHRSHGQIRMADLAAQSYLSSSQFERQFKHYTAISPKAYARIVRFGSLQAALLVNPSIRLADLADVYGYSDQAHLIREFKSLHTVHHAISLLLHRPILNFGKMKIGAIS